MKERYEELIVEMIRFEEEDVITFSCTTFVLCDDEVQPV